MGFSISVDKEKCDHDGICVAECPERAIEMGEDGYPRPSKHGEVQCIQCGHCVAFCPTGAFALNTMAPEQCDPVVREPSLSQTQIEQLVRTRRSIRTYKNSSVPRDILRRLINLARYAPTAKNLQPVHWTVIEERESVNEYGEMVIDWMRAMLEKKAEPIFTDFLLGLIIEDAEKGGDWITRGAPHIIVTHGPNDLPIPASQSGCTIALTTLELAAPAFGLGACWAGYFNAAVNLWPPLSQALAIPANHGCYGAMMVGYPRNECYRIPIRKDAPIRWL